MPKLLRRSGVFNFNFEKISHIALVFIILTLEKLIADGYNQCTVELLLKVTVIILFITKFIPSFKVEII